jgi:hypothetical protein
MQRRAATGLVAGLLGSVSALGAEPVRAGVTSGQANAAVIRLPLAKGLSPADCVQSMQLRANLLNMKQVGDLPLSGQVQAMTGKPQRLIRVLLFCDPLTAVQMVDGSLDFAAYLPCRITLVEDEKGDCWLVMMNLQPLIDSVPPGSPLRTKAEMVGNTLMSIMQAGAKGSL